MAQPVLTYMQAMPASTFDTEVCAPPYSDFIRELYNSRLRLRKYMHTAQKKEMKKAMKKVEMSTEPLSGLVYSMYLTICTIGLCRRLEEHMPILQCE